VLRSRLARLSGEAHDFANAAAVLGGAFDFDQVRAMVHQDEDVALDALERLLATQLLREVEGPLYTFSHDKIRQVAYDDLSAARRRVLHRRAFEALSTPNGITTPVERLAYHALRAQAWPEAQRWSEQAAREALAVFAYGAAAALYEQALDCLAHQPVTPGQRRAGITLRLSLAHVALYLAPGRLDEWLRPAETEADALALGDEPLLARVWLARATALYIQGHFSDALPLLERIRPLADPARDPELRAGFLSTLGQLLALRGDYAGAISALEEALSLLPPAASIERTVATEMLAATHAYKGDFPLADQLLQEIHQGAERSQDQTRLAASLGFLEAVHQMKGNWAAAREYGQRAIAVARDAGDVVHEYIGYVFVGLPAARQGAPDDGALALQQAIGIAQAAGIWVLLGRAYGWLALVDLVRGQPETALQAAITGQELSEQHGYLFDPALCQRARGEALLALGDLDAADNHLRSAWQRLEAIGALPEVARTRAALAHLAVQRGALDEAVQHARACESLRLTLSLGDDFAIPAEIQARVSAL
jgi:tetratricopeptide (TPR) repeat protein